MAPLIEQLVQEFEGQIELVKVDADQAENEAKLTEYDVRSIPTLIMTDENGKALSRLVGQKSLAELKSWVQACLAWEWEPHDLRYAEDV
jgi:thioredoxin 1